MLSIVFDVFSTLVPTILDVDESWFAILAFSLLASFARDIMLRNFSTRLLNSLAVVPISSLPNTGTFLVRSHSPIFDLTELVNPSIGFIK